MVRLVNCMLPFLASSVMLHWYMYTVGSLCNRLGQEQLNLVATICCPCWWLAQNLLVWLAPLGLAHSANVLSKLGQCA